MPPSMLKQQSKGSIMRNRNSVLVAYLVPRMLPVVLARVMGYRAPPSLAVFKDLASQQIEISEVPL